MEDEKIWSNEDFSEMRHSQEEYLKGITDEFNREITKGSRVSFRKAYEALGIPLSHVNDSWYDDFGWDKDGFGRIYKTITIRVPVSTKTGEMVLTEEELRMIKETSDKLEAKLRKEMEADVMFNI